MQKNVSNRDSISKDVVRSLLKLCQSDRECECIRYTVYKASGLSATLVRKRYGFGQMNERSKAVDNALQHAKYIRESIDELAKSKDQSMFGLTCDDGDSDFSNESADDEVMTDADQPFNIVEYDTPRLVEVARNSIFNFFEIVERIRGCTLSQTVLLEILKGELTEKEYDQLQISYEAF